MAKAKIIYHINNFQVKANEIKWNKKINIIKNILEEI